MRANQAQPTLSKGRGACSGADQRLQNVVFLGGRRGFSKPGACTVRKEAQARARLPATSTIWCRAMS